VPLYKNLIGVLASKVNIFDRFIFVIFAVVPFIDNELIEPELLIDVDVITLVCRFPELNIFPLVVKDPEHTILLVDVTLDIFDYIITI
jgi:hypothetical protein